MFLFLGTGAVLLASYWELGVGELTRREIGGYRVVSLCRLAVDAQAQADAVTAVIKEQDVNSIVYINYYYYYYYSMHILVIHSVSNETLTHPPGLILNLQSPLHCIYRLLL